MSLAWLSGGGASKQAALWGCKRAGTARRNKLTPSTPTLNPLRAMYALENTFTTLLDFGGIASSEAEGAISRAGKGGMVGAKQLRGLVTLLDGELVPRTSEAAACPCCPTRQLHTTPHHTAPPNQTSAGADRLKRQIALTARQNRATGRDSPLRPLLDATTPLVVPRGLMGAITAAIQEDGTVADSASEQVGRRVYEWGGGCSSSRLRVVSVSGPHASSICAAPHLHSVCAGVRHTCARACAGQPHQQPAEGLPR